MKNLVHAALGVIAIALIGSFIGTTIYAEFSGSGLLIADVKTLIVFPGLALLIPVLASTGALGAYLAKLRGTVAPGIAMHLKKKTARMRFIAANGILILVPCALLLKTWAVAGDFSATFYIVQILEIAAGTINLTLLVMNMRDGLILRRALGRHPEASGEAASSEIGATADLR